MSILIVGTVAFDAIETPFGKTDKIVGGAATYISLSSSFFTKELNLVSVVGEDFPKSAIKMLEDHNVCTKGLQIKEGQKTFFWSGKYHNDMNTRDTLDTQLNVLENFDPIVPEKFQESKFLMLGNLMPSVQKKVLDQMKKRTKLVVLDTMNFWMDLFMDDLKEALREVALDIQEGADFVMVKPGMPYLDIIKLVKDNFKIPVFAYQVSGEYSLIKNGINDKILTKDAIYESLISFKRAGANAIVTYFADEIADELIQSNRFKRL